MDGKLRDLERAALSGGHRDAAHLLALKMRLAKPIYVGCIGCKGYGFTGKQASSGFDLSLGVDGAIEKKLASMHHEKCGGTGKVIWPIEDRIALAAYCRDPDALVLDGGPYTDHCYGCETPGIRYEGTGRENGAMRCASCIAFFDWLTGLSSFPLEVLIAASVIAARKVSSLWQVSLVNRCHTVDFSAHCAADCAECRSYGSSFQDPELCVESAVRYVNNPRASSRDEWSLASVRAGAVGKSWVPVAPVINPGNACMKLILCVLSCSGMLHVKQAVFSGLLDWSLGNCLL